MPNTFTKFWHVLYCPNAGRRPLQTKHQWNWRWYFSPPRHEKVFSTHQQKATYIGMQDLSHFRIQCFETKSVCQFFLDIFSTAWPQVTYTTSCVFFWSCIVQSYLIHDFSFKATLQFGSSCFQIALTAMDTIHLPRPQLLLSFCLIHTTWSSSTLSRLKSLATLD